MERGTNYNVLSIGGMVDRGLVSVRYTVFQLDVGNLALRGKDFVLAEWKALLAVLCSNWKAGSPVIRLSAIGLPHNDHDPTGRSIRLLGHKHASKFAFAGRRYCLSSTVTVQIIIERKLGSDRRRLQICRHHP
jgi:hypothetical protein